MALLIHSKLKHLITKTRAISDRVIYVMLKLNSRYSIQIIQAYAPTSASADEDTEQFYEDLTTAKISEKAKFTIMMGDFNAKIGPKTPADSPSIGAFGLGARNPRGQTMIDFLNRKKMYCLNTFFKKHHNRKWTWSPDGKVKNEIDFILATDKRICEDVSVLNRFDSSDHRLVRAKIVVNTHLERNRLMAKKIRPTIGELRGKEEKYNTQLERKLQPSEELQGLEMNALSTKIASDIRTAVKKICSLQKRKNPKLSLETVRQIEEKRSTDRDSPIYKELNKSVKKVIRRDKRTYNTQEIQKAIENNMNMKVLRSNLFRGKLVIHRMKNELGEVVTEKLLKTSTESSIASQI